MLELVRKPAVDGGGEDGVGWGCFVSFFENRKELGVGISLTIGKGRAYFFSSDPVRVWTWCV